MSRQMAFQLNQMDVLKRFALILKTRTPGKPITVGEALSTISSDAKELDKLRSVYTLMCKFLEDPQRVMRCTKLVAWRTPERVEKFELEVEFSKHDPPPWMLKDSGVFDLIPE